MNSATRRTASLSLERARARSV